MNLWNRGQNSGYCGMGTDIRESLGSVNIPYRGLGGGYVDVRKNPSYCRAEICEVHYF